MGLRASNIQGAGGELYLAEQVRQPGQTAWLEPLWTF